MSKKRRHVEIESDLNNSESQSDHNRGVEDPQSYGDSRNDTSRDYDNNVETNGGQDNHTNGSENNTNVSHPQDINQQNDNGNTNNKVYDGNQSTEPSNVQDKENNVETNKDSPSNNASNHTINHQDKDTNSNDDQTQKDNQSNHEEADKKHKETASDTNNKDSDSESKKDAKNKVTNSSQQEDNNKSITQNLGDKLGNHSNTAQKLNQLRNFNNIKNMSKEQAKDEVIEIGKEYAKKKIIAAFMTYVAPYLVPIILLLITIILFIVVIIAAIAGSGGENSKKTQKNCGPVNSDNSSSISVSKDAMKNAEKIYEYEMKHVDGAKPKAVAAHLGNMDVESQHSFDPKTVQSGNEFKESIAKDGSVGGYALGIAQWDSERRVNLLKYAEKKNKKWSDFGIQLDFMLNHDGADSDMIKKLLKSDGSVGSTTEKIMNDWERAGDKSSIGQRKSAASKFYSKFSKKDISSKDGNIDDASDAASDNSDASENSGCSDTADTGGSGEIGESVKANGKSGKIIKDWDSKDKIPEKYKKHIKIPDFKESVLDSPKNIFPATGNKGQCTELTWGYMQQMHGGNQPSNGNGNVIYKAYKSQGAKVTANPTVGYGFSSDPPMAGAADSSVGHTGIVAGVMKNGDWIMANYNLHGEGNKGQKRHLTYALVDGNKKSGGIKFFDGIGKSKVKTKKKD